MFPKSNIFLFYASTCDIIILKNQSLAFNQFSFSRLEDSKIFYETKSPIYAVPKLICLRICSSLVLKV